MANIGHYGNYTAQKIIENEKVDGSSHFILSSKGNFHQMITENFPTQLPSSFQFKAELIKGEKSSNNNVEFDSSSLQITLQDDMEPEKCLWLAVKSNKVGLAKLLLTTEPKFIFSKTEQGMTLMHEAVIANNWSMLELLFKEGGKINIIDNNKTTLLHLSSLKGHLLISAHLIIRDQELIEARDKQKRTALHLAAQQGHREVAALLLNSGALREAQDERGWTPLHTAAAYGKNEMIEFLLLAGANYQATDKNGLLPEKVAEKEYASAALLFTRFRENQYKPTSYGMHHIYSGLISKTPYIIYDNLTADELHDVKKQLEVKIEMPANAKEFTWPKRSGSFGVVGLARNMFTGQFVASKMIKGDRAVKSSINESKIQKFLQGQPHLMPLYDYTEHTENGTKIILQYMLWASMDGKDLKKKLKALKNPPELYGLDPLIKHKVLTHVTHSLLKALDCMHKLTMYHRDVKSGNVMIDSSNGKVYLSDFGHTIQSDSKMLKAEDAVGDYHYQSPEALECMRTGTGSYDAELSDGWSLGITLLEIGGYFNVKKHFHRNIHDLTIDYMNGVIAKVPVLKNPQKQTLFALIKGLLAPNLKERLCISAALNYMIFKNSPYQFSSDEEQKETFRIFDEMDFDIKFSDSDSEWDLGSKSNPQFPYKLSPQELSSYQPLLTQVYVEDLPKSQKDDKEPVIPYNLNSNGSSVRGGSSLGEKEHNDGLKAYQAKKFLEAAELLEKAEKKGYIKSSTYLGILHSKGGKIDKTDKNYQFINEKGDYRIKAIANADATFKIDKLKAEMYFRKGANGGHPRAMNLLGDMLRDGDGIKANKQEALKWYKAAMENVSDPKEQEKGKKAYNDLLAELQMYNIRN